MLKALLSVVRFLWSACTGYRLRPWCSPYLRWRVETYSGKPAATLVASDFVRLAWRERGQMMRFLRWLHEMEQLREEVQS